MKIGFISDAHGNPDGLARCLGALAVEGCEQIYFLGDAVGYLPEENAVFELLDASGAICILGNHEAMLLERLALSPSRDEVYRLSEVRARILPRWRSLIASWPMRLELEIEGAKLLLVHGSPESPLEGYVYPDTELSSFSALAQDFVFMGQTHRPFCRKHGNVTVVNVGSSGMPRDVGNLASCALYDSATRRVEILRIEFDAHALAQKWQGRIAPASAACLLRTAALDSPFGRTVQVAGTRRG
jgi:predicted phosphodiesterase